MSHTRPSWLPILIGVLAIVFTIAVLVAWNIVFTRYYMLATRGQTVPDLGVGYWLTLSVGSLLLVMVVVTLLLLLIGNVRQTLNLNRQKLFIDNVTHELKSPLASLSVALETIETRKLSPDMQSKFVAMMKKDVIRLRSFIDHVLDAGKLEHGERELTLQMTDCTNVACECIQRMCERHGLRSDEIRFESGLDAGASILTDRIALETILLNLLDNAIKYSNRPVDIRVDASRCKDRIQLRVKDQGVGIARSELKRVFERFYRIERQGSSAKGTGLGLYVVAVLAKQLGGRATAASEGEGRGSTFMVELPIQIGGASKYVRAASR